MIRSNPSKSSSNPVTLVPESRRMSFIPDLFGPKDFFVGEQLLYSLMDQLSPDDYGGGLWEFYERNGVPLFMAPTGRVTYRLSWHGNGFDGEVSAEVAGIIATLFALSHLSFSSPTQAITDSYCRLFDYAAEHTEAPVIFRAID